MALSVLAPQRSLICNPLFGRLLPFTMTVTTLKPQGSIIVVEDDDLTRVALTEALTDEGFNVIQAVDADDARMLLEHGATGIYALITDNRMPGSMNGVRLTRHAHENWPWINLVLAAYLVEAEAVLPPGCRYFQKPYRLSQLVEHLREIGSTPRMA